MIKKLKKVILDRFFKEELKEAETNRLKLELDVIKAKNSIVDLTREHLKLFNPKTLDKDTDILEEFDTIEKQNEFILKIREVALNPQFRELVLYLKRNQIMFAITEAETLTKINFARATLNGLSLVESEIDRMNTIYESRKPDSGEYDKHSVMPED